MLFRTWPKPRVRAGGTQRSHVGVLLIDAVEAVPLSMLSTADARGAGFRSLAELRADIGDREGTLYRIRLHRSGPDPRVALRERSTLSTAEFDELVAKLEKLDRSSSRGSWTHQVLALLAQHPAVRAPDLAAARGMETKPFKLDVRKLKELGLTESLEVGYRLSPRGRALLAMLPRGKGRLPRLEPRRRSEAWHAAHPEPLADRDEQVRWHIAHARACGCRSVPAALVPLLPLTRR